MLSFGAGRFSMKTRIVIAALLFAAGLAFAGDNVTDTSVFEAGTGQTATLKTTKAGSVHTLHVNVDSGATTVADGADATQGAKADAAVIDPAASASVVALLKGLLTQLQGQYTPAITVETGDGTIDAGKRHIEFILSSDFAGTIQGAAISGATLSVYDPGAPPVGSTLGAVGYTISAGNATITTW